MRIKDKVLKLGRLSGQKELGGADWARRQGQGSFEIFRHFEMSKKF